MAYERKTYDGRVAGLPELELFGWVSTDCATQSRLTRHRHENAFEICLIANGAVHWWVNDESYRLRRGDVYVTQPDEPHGAVDGVMHPCELYWLILPRPGDEALPGLSRSDTREIFDRLSTLQQRAFDASATLRQCFRGLQAELSNRGLLSLTAARGLFHGLLVQVIRDHDLARASGEDARYSADIARTLDWLRKNFSEDISVSDMARIAGISIGQFHERFHKEVGLTPSAYLTQARILRARDLLRGSERSVSEIAFELGFSSSQYFATVFKKHIGTTPGLWRKAARDARESAERHVVSSGST